MGREHLVHSKQTLICRRLLQNVNGASQVDACCKSCLVDFHAAMQTHIGELHFALSEALTSRGKPLEIPLMGQGGQQAGQVRAGGRRWAHPVVDVQGDCRPAPSGSSVVTL